LTWYALRTSLSGQLSNWWGITLWKYCGYIGSHHHVGPDHQGHLSPCCVLLLGPCCHVPSTGPCLLWPVSQYLWSK
jgi:hypothetical protein